MVIGGSTAKVHRTGADYKAYMALWQVEQARAKFQKLLGRRTIVQNNLFCSPAHLRLGRAYVMQGDNTKAIY